MTVSLLAGATPVILIVDDDEVIRMLMRQFLEAEGYVVVEAEDGRSALDKVGEQSVDLVHRPQRRAKPRPPKSRRRNLTHR